MSQIEGRYQTIRTRRPWRRPGCPAASTDWRLQWARLHWSQS